jgi:hypothetical protein
MRAAIKALVLNLQKPDEEVTMADNLLRGAVSMFSFVAIVVLVLLVSLLPFYLSLPLVALLVVVSLGVRTGVVVESLLLVVGFLSLCYLIFVGGL